VSRKEEEGIEELKKRNPKASEEARGGVKVLGEKG